MREIPRGSLAARERWDRLSCIFRPLLPDHLRREPAHRLGIRIPAGPPSVSGTGRAGYARGDRARRPGPSPRLSSRPRRARAARATPALHPPRIASPL